jgi:hypothetical protein
MKNIFLLFLLILLFPSCEKEEITNSISIGNIYCSDGSTINPANYSESGKKAVGVIFWVNSQENSSDPKALVVGLKDLPPALWADSLIAIQNVSTDLFEFNGVSNTASIVSWGIDESRKTTAITNAYNYSYLGVVGWFVPSFGEAKFLYSQKNTVQSSLNICGGDMLSDWYWTSTQDGSGTDNSKLNAVAISQSEGNATVSYKLNAFPVRPIIAIK